MQLILASNSPRRQAMLKELGIPYKIQIQNVDESFETTTPVFEVPLLLAKRKAEAFIPSLQADEVVLTADTVVICEGKILNKPNSREEAIEMLSLLSGKKHTVVTGFCLTAKNHQIGEADKTDVYFRTLTLSEITHYVDSYKPFDKAGSYGVQEWIGMTGITRIDGSYFTVVGLPVHLVYEKLQEMKEYLTK